MFRSMIGTLLILTQSLLAQALTISGDVRDASDNPLVSNSVTFEFSILNPAQNCVLYRETHFRDMSASGGFFSAELGAGSAAYNGNTALENVFANAGSLNCEGGGSYTPTATDRRLVKIGFNAGAGWRYISDLVPITQAAWAMHSKSSENSQKLNGLSASSYLLKPGAACAGVVGFDGTTLTCSPIASLAVDWSSLTNKPSTFAPSAHTHDVDAITSATGKYFSYQPNNVACAANDILKWDGSRWICGVDSAGTPGITALTGDVTASGSGSVPSTVVSIGGKTAAQVASAVDNIATVPTTYLARSGGLMTGAIDMGQQNLTNTGHITMFPSKTIHLSNNSTTPAGLTGSDRGKFWYNSTTDKIEYWNGATVKSIGIEGGIASDLASLTGTGIVQRTGAASYTTLGLTPPLNTVAGNIFIESSGVTSGTYGNTTMIPSFTVNDKGLITAASSNPLTWANISAKPTTLGGYGIVDALSSTAGGDVSGSIGIKSAQSLKLWNTANTNFVALKSPPSLGSSVTWTLPPADGSSGQVLTTNGSGSLTWSNAGGGGITSINGLTSSAQTFNIGSTGLSPSWSPSGAIHTLNLPMADISGVTAGLLSNADYINFNNKISSGFIFTGGDLSGSINSPSVNKIRGVNVDSTPPVTGQVLSYDGGQWRPQAPYINNSFGANMVLATPEASSGSGSFRFLKRPDIKSNVSGDFFGNTTCGLGQALVYLSASDQIICQNITIADGNIDPSRALWSRSGANIHWPTGNVGIGTSTPAMALDVVGTIRSDDIIVTSGSFQTTIESSATTNYTILLPYQPPTEIRTLVMNPSGQILFAATPSYTNAVLTNSYSQAVAADLGYGVSPPPVQYWKDEAGIVYLRGVIKNGNGNHAFVLDPGFRPAHLTILPAATSGGPACHVAILPTGEVKPGSSCSPAWTSLNGISFRRD